MYYIRVRAYDATTTTDLGSYRISTDNVKVKVRLCGIRSQTRLDSAVYAHLIAVTDDAVYDLSVGITVGKLRDGQQHASGAR